MNKLLTIFILLGLLEVEAQVLPIFGAPSKECVDSIKIPDPDNDVRLAHLKDYLRGVSINSYEVDKDCGVIFVKPPLFGKMEVEKPSLTTKLRRCEIIDEEYNYLISLLKLRSNAMARGQEQKAEYYNSQIEEKQSELDVVEAVEGLTFKVHMYSNYGKLLEAFNIANTPEDGSPSKFTIAPLPIYGMYLSANLKEKSAYDVATKPVLIESQIPGVHRTVDQISGTKFEDSFGNRIFDGSLSGIIKLSLTGSCEYKTTPSDEDLQNVTSFMAANVTYFYPVKTNTKYKIHIGSEAVVNLVHKILRRHKHFIVEIDFVREAQSLAASGEIDIQIDQGITTQPLSVQEINNLKSDVVKSFAQFVLAHIADHATTDENQVKTYKINLSNLNERINSVTTQFKQTFEQNSAFVKTGTFTFSK